MIGSVRSPAGKGRASSHGNRCSKDKGGKISLGGRRYIKSSSHHTDGITHDREE
jgi:hypothetical protein